MGPILFLVYDDFSDALEKKIVDLQEKIPNSSNPLDYLDEEVDNLPVSTLKELNVVAHLKILNIDMKATYFPSSFTYFRSFGWNIFLFLWWKVGKLERVR